MHAQSSNLIVKLGMWYYANVIAIFGLITITLHRAVAEMASHTATPIYEAV